MSEFNTIIAQLRAKVDAGRKAEAALAILTEGESAKPRGKAAKTGNGLVKSATPADYSPTGQS